MGSKRSRPVEGENEDVLPEPPERKRPKKKFPKIDMGTLRPPVAVNQIKRKIRDVRRTLERSENLSADVRVEKERALAGYKQDLEKSEHEKRTQQMIKKYHMVRFFERQKATRRLKRLKKLLSAMDKASEEYVDLKQKIHRAEVDLNYTLYSPLAEKYTSLYKQKDDTSNGDITMSNDSMISQGSEALLVRPPMWITVEKCMAEGTLWALRDGKVTRAAAIEASTDGSSGQKKDSSRRKKSGEERFTKNNLKGTQDALNGDDGFFEE